MKIEVSNILDLIEFGGESYVQSKLSSFSCPKNAEIENFLKRNAIQFAKQGISITYLVFGRGEEINYLLGYFTLTYKVIQIKREKIKSNNAKKMIARFGDFDKVNNSYTLPTPLIAQFGKNSAPVPDPEYKISGDDLMKRTLDQVREIQHMAGGRIVYLECENIPKLLEFYDKEKHRFDEFSERTAQADGNTIFYHQLLKILK